MGRRNKQAALHRRALLGVCCDLFPGRCDGCRMMLIIATTVTATALATTAGPAPATIGVEARPGLEPDLEPDPVVYCPACWSPLQKTTGGRVDGTQPEQEFTFSATHSKTSTVLHKQQHHHPPFQAKSPDYQRFGRLFWRRIGAWWCDSGELSGWADIAVLCLKSKLPR